MNKVRKCMFTSKYEKGKKSLDLCMVPPCQENLNLHMRRRIIQQNYSTLLICYKWNMVEMRILQLCGVI